MPTRLTTPLSMSQCLRNRPFVKVAENWTTAVGPSGVDTGHHGQLDIEVDRDRRGSAIGVFASGGPPFSAYGGWPNQGRVGRAPSIVPERTDP